MEHMRNEYDAASEGRFRSLPLVVSVSLLLLFVQGAALVHSHGDDLEVHHDCDICLKIGSGIDFIAADHVHEPVKPAQHEWLDIQTESPFLPLLDLRSRAPPRA